MKKLILTFAVLGITLTACKQNNQEPEIKTVGEETEEVTTNDVTPEYATTSFTIKGMTCEIGCAKTIQNKLQRTKGIKSAEVDFESETAKVEFDKNTLTEKQIDEIVEKVGGGDTYKVVH